jgi:hypothetical protein
VGVGPIGTQSVYAWISGGKAPPDTPQTRQTVAQMLGIAPEQVTWSPEQLQQAQQANTQWEGSHSQWEGIHRGWPAVAALGLLGGVGGALGAGGGGGLSDAFAGGSALGAGEAAGPSGGLLAAAGGAKSLLGLGSGLLNMGQPQQQAAAAPAAMPAQKQFNSIAPEIQLQMLRMKPNKTMEDLQRLQGLLNG